MHVVMLTNAVAPDKLGGLERYVSELSAELVRQGCQVTVVTKQISRGDALDETRDDGVRVLRYRMPSKRNPAFALQYPFAVASGVRRALRSAGPYDVLHAHFPLPALVPAAGRTPFVYTLHAPVWRELLSERQGSYALPTPVQRPARAGLRGAERFVVRRASRVLTLSSFMRSEVAALDPAVGDAVELVAGGIDTTRFVPGNDVGLGSGSGPVLFTARRLVPRTGVVELVRAMPAVLEAHPDARLFVAGAGLQRELIDSEIVRLGLGASVSMLGRISDEDLVRWYQDATLVVTPTQQLEGFGLATAEAMACASPCLVTPVGANPELVEGIPAPLVSRDATPSGLADGIVALLATPDLLQEIRTQCRAVVVPAMGWPAIAERHVEVYARVGAEPRVHDEEPVR